MNSIAHFADVGGLGHLVEAATALARLNEPTSSASDTKPYFAVSSPSMQVPAASVVSSDDENAGSSRRREIFPQRLMAILSDASLTDVVTWLPHGRSFVIIRPDVFTDIVLPKYLPPVDARASAKYPSFTRKLNRWGFRQATRGPETGAFHHPLFHRNQPSLCLEMVCQRSRDRKSSTPTNTTSNSKLPLKKRSLIAITTPIEVAPLTKEHLDAMSSPERQTHPPPVATVSVSDDSRSVASNSTSSQQATPQLPQPGIAFGRAVVVIALKERDQMERIKVAQAMLREAYLQALRGE